MPRKTSSVVGIGPMKVFHRKHDRLDPRAGHHPVRERRQLPVAQFLWWQSVCA
jgi:hypothetical protein